MKQDYLEKINSFDIDSLPDLDEVVLASLQFLGDTKVPKIDTDKYKRPLAIGSGNAFRTGQVIFGDVDAVFADEGDYRNAIKKAKNIDAVYIISASGGKHSTEIAREVGELGVPVFLITNNEDAPAAEYVNADNVFVFPNIREPYTYNTSTYMSMMLGANGNVSTSETLEYIESNISNLDFSLMSDMEAFVLIVPPEFGIMREFFTIKFDELFEPVLSGRSFSTEEIKHAKIVVGSDKEFFLSFGVENKYYGEEKNRLFIPIPEDCTYATFMAIGYYVIGRIQKQYPPYFKENIVAYTELASKLFGQKINPITE